MSEPEHIRIRKAANIAARPHRFVLCEGCGSILSRATLEERGNLCWCCRSYRFEACPHCITEAAYALAQQEPVMPEICMED